MNKIFVVILDLVCYNTFERKFLASFLSEAVRPKGGVDNE